MRKLIIVCTTTIVSLGLMTGCWNQTAPKKKNKITSQARHKATMRPYEVLGKAYEPTFIKAGETMSGISSWYGPTFHGKYTSNGEIYDMHEMTAAHKTWPMDTMVKVHNHDNGKSVIVRITDRGPFVDGRIIDCSYAAGKAIGLDKAGIAKVTITALSFKSKLEGGGQLASKQTISPNKKADIWPTKLPLDTFSIQVGAFKNMAVADSAKAKYAMLDNRRVVNTKSFSGNDGEIYKVCINGFGTEAEARDFIMQHKLETNIIIRG